MACKKPAEWQFRCHKEKWKMTQNMKDIKISYKQISKYHINRISALPTKNLNPIETEANCLI